MATITSSIGLTTGLDIESLVEKLMALSATRRTLLKDRTDKLTEKLTATTELATYLYSVRLISDNLGKADLFNARTATSSSESVLKASATAETSTGTYYFASVRTAQTQQYLSKGVSSSSESLGGGAVSFRYGDNVERSMSLSHLGGGAGFSRGQIRITDRSGASAQIDLSTAQTVDDVLDAINGNTQINVTAVAGGDGFKLIDNTGLTTSKLIVQEVSGGTTAASLGLDAINVAASVASGKDMIYLYEGLKLSELNDGAGVNLNAKYLADINYTLRDGTTGSVDLSQLAAGASDSSLTISDVLNKINAANPSKLKLEISGDGDRLVITDLTNATVSASLDTVGEPGNDGSGVIDQEGSLGFTSGGSESQAASLTAALDGANNDLIFQTGRYGADLNDIEVILVDNEGTSNEAFADYDANAKTLTISINRGVTTAATVSAAVTEEFQFSVASSSGSSAAEDLGIAGSSSGGSISGGRIMGGMKTVLLSSLNGGKGYGELGVIALTDRSGDSDTVDLSGSKTLEDVINAINAADVRILARVNAAKNGIELVDQSGSTSGNLIVADGGDGLTTAQRLGIDVDEAVNSVAGGDMHLQVVSRNTKLAALNGGQGVAAGKFTIIGTSGKSGTVDLTDEDVQTVGDVIDAVNRLDIGVVAEINDTGDGILIRDTDQGSGTISILEGSSTTAGDLNLLGGVVEVERDGTTYKAVDGSMTYTITLDADDTISDLKDKINDLGIGATASIFNDGSSTPYRLSVNGNISGSPGAFIFDSSGLALEVEKTAAAQDAVLVYGSPNDVAKGILMSSSSNTFSEILPGLNVTVSSASTQAVTVTVGRSAANALASMQALVGNYNNFRGVLNELTEYNEETEEAGLLLGDSAAIRLDTELSDLLTGTFSGSGSITTLAQVGLTVKSDGTLEFDSDVFSALFAEDPDALAQFFTGITSEESSEDYGITVTTTKTSTQTEYTSSVTTVTVDHELLNQRFADDPQGVMKYLRSLVHGGELEDFGIFVANGQVTIDENIFRSKYLTDSIFASNLQPQTTGGVSKAFAQTIEKLSGEDYSLLAQQYKVLEDKIAANESKLEEIDKILKIKQTRLYTQFYNMELSIAKLQSNYEALSALPEFKALDFGEDDDD